MPRTALHSIIGFAALSLTACNSESPDPVEQIVVREPGEAQAGGTAAQSILAGGMVEAGKSAFSACAACHAVEVGAASGAGPNLNGVVGRTAGTLADYSYSNAMAASGVVWNAAALDEFLINPSAKIPGTAMVAGAVSDDAEREAIVAYLASLSQ